MNETGKQGIEDVDRGDLEAFIEYEQDRGLKLSTVRLRLATIKAFLRYMIENGVVNEEVFPWKLTIKMPEALPRAIAPDDVERLLTIKGSVRDRAFGIASVEDWHANRGTLENQSDRRRHERKENFNL